MLRAVLLIFSIFLTQTSLSQATQSNYGLILQYHHVSDNTPPITSVTPKTFQKHLELIEALDLTVVPVETLISNIKNKIAFKNKVVSITFDDGYESIYTHAFPLLKAKKLPFTIFVNPLAIDQKHQRQMTWDQLREMEKHGATIANHTQYHNHLLNRLTSETIDQWLERTEQDINDAQKRLEEELKNPKEWLAYPYGEFDHHIKSRLSKMGYLGFSQQSGGIHETTDWQAIPRFPASGIYSREKTLTVKLNSKPFHILNTKPKAQLRFISEPAPNLELTIQKDDVQTYAIQCFFSGDAIKTDVMTEKDTVVIKTQAATALPLGRSRYNCTAPSRIKGQYYWYSMPFITTNPQYQWVD